MKDGKTIGRVDMNYILYVLAALGIVFIIFLYWLGRTTFKIRNEMSSNPRYFNNAVELMGFIRNVFECKVKDKVVMYGFVESTYIDNGELTYTEPALMVDAFLITKDGHKFVNSTCGILNANLKKGDFVAILPFYNQRHNLWTYITIAKLNYHYLGKEQNFSVSEQYID